MTNKTVYTYTFPRLMGLDDESLVRIAPDYAVDIIAARVVFANAVGFVCHKPGKKDKAIDEIPDDIDFLRCRRLEVRDTTAGLFVCLCDELRERNVLYQTRISHSGWKRDKVLVDRAVGKMNAACALRP